MHINTGNWVILDLLSICYQKTNDLALQPYQSSKLTSFRLNKYLLTEAKWPSFSLTCMNEIEEQTEFRVATFIIHFDHVVNLLQMFLLEKNTVKLYYKELGYYKFLVITNKQIIIAYLLGYPVLLGIFIVSCVSLFLCLSPLPLYLSTVSLYLSISPIYLSISPLYLSISPIYLSICPLYLSLSLSISPIYLSIFPLYLSLSLQIRNSLL